MKPATFRIDSEVRGPARYFDHPIRAASLQNMARVPTDSLVSVWHAAYTESILNIAPLRGAAFAPSYHFTNAAPNAAVKVQAASTRGASSHSRSCLCKYSTLDLSKRLAAAKTPIRLNTTPKTIPPAAFVVAYLVLYAFAPRALVAQHGFTFALGIRKPGVCKAMAAR